MVADWFVAGGTLALATVTAWSVRRSSAQLRIERQRLEAAQWPRVFPAPTSDWIHLAVRPEYTDDHASKVMPVTNGGPGVAMNLQGEMDFTQQGGTLVRFVPTSLAAGQSAELPLSWTTKAITNWDKVNGRLYYEDIAGARWQTHFWISVNGNTRHRHIHVKETEMVMRADGTALGPPDNLKPAAWYTPDPPISKRFPKPRWLKRPKRIWTK